MNSIDWKLVWLCNYPCNPYLSRFDFWKFKNILWYTRRLGHSRCLIWMNEKAFSFQNWAWFLEFFFTFHVRHLVCILILPQTHKLSKNFYTIFWICKIILMYPFGYSTTYRPKYTIVGNQKWAKISIWWYLSHTNILCSYFPNSAFFVDDRLQTKLVVAANIPWDRHRQQRQQPLVN